MDKFFTNFRNNLKLNLVIFFLNILLFAALYIYADRYYLSESIIEVYEQDSSMSSGLDSIKGIASSFGVGIGGTQTNNVMKALEIIKSRSFANELIERNNFLLRLLAVSHYDQANALEVIDSKIFKKDEGVFLGKLASFNQQELKSLAYDEYYKVVSIAKSQTGFLKLRALTKSPVFSHELLIAILDHYNEIERSKDLQEASNSINYLRERLKNELDAGVRNSFIQELMVHERDRLKIFQRQDYILSFIDGPNIPTIKSRPVLLMYLISGLLFSMLLIVIFAIPRSDLIQISAKE